ncbi:ubiquitin carboxyl-terminal hydrolase 48 [Microplitis demolitor]|uniref:ubiquitin carboxyl-terminal hydrolase 48 n=1 Tax=Microplitis demolitor TaxID=69319 RepID=UPI0004CD69BC|nr:ubiquitin carboxyl-terminal hydrolase 48 [Microplitis demolitor]XP_053599112.1 ubiquitin carboxyl-terminal hydrolase 48 [Microplitis demolitor]
MPNRAYPKRADVAEKEAWSWSESVSPDNITNEHLDLAYRVSLNICKNCKRNCSYNPRCLVGLGEEKYLKSQPIESASLESSLAELRDPTQYVGLKNLGATCYVNSLIQVWFHNEDMRRIIYKWNITEDPEERESLQRSQGKNSPYQPVTVVGQLQYIFAMMQFGNRRLLDPTSLARALSLDTGTQQDAQEFSKLLLAHIEGKIQQNHHLKTLLQRLTQGTYIYVNRCSTCSTEYETPTTFYELDLQLAPTLKQAIGNYLSEEDLSGTNKYLCMNCKDKRDAKRFIRLNTLPDTLNFQLLRFVFHRESAQKKKLTSSIQFPEELDMSEYLNCPAGTHLYSLVAVLSHKGPSTHSGHYIVNICKSSDEWYQFSDDKVERMHNKRIEDGINDGGGKVKKTKILKGCLSSNSAYMLVYKRLSKERSAAKESLKLNDRNNLADDEIFKDNDNDKNKIKIKDLNITDNGKRKEPVDLDPDDSPSLFSPSKKYKSDDDQVNDKEFDELMEVGDKNSHVKSAVRKIAFDDKVNQEVNDVDSWEKKYRSLNGDAHRAMSCCKRDYYENLEFDKWELSETLRKIVRQENDTHQDSLLAIQEENLREIDNQNIKRQEVIDLYGIIGKGDWNEYEWIPTSWLTKWLNDHSGNPEAVVPVDNSVLMCSHGRLDPLKINRAKCVPREAAEMIFKKYKGGPRMDNKSLCEGCVKRRCRVLRFQAELERDKKEVMEIMKQIKEFNEDCFIVGANSLKNWRRLAMELLDDKDNQGDNCGFDDHEHQEEHHDADDEADRILNFNEDLHCEHGELRTPDAGRKIVPAAAWSILKKYFPKAAEYPYGAAACMLCEEKVENAEKAKKDDKIKAKMQKEELGDLYYMKNRVDITKCEGKVFYVVEKGFLDSWKSFIRSGGRHPPTEINNDKLLCQDHKGFVHKPIMSTEKKYSIVTSEEWAKLSDFYKTDCSIQITFSENDFHTVPEQCNSCIEAREEQERMDLLTYENASIFIQCVEGAEEPESAVKSSRPSRSRRKAKGSHELKVSSQITLKELKVMTMNICGAPPMDQHLLLGEHELEDSSQHIGALGVYPGAMLRLKIDTPQDGETNPESDSVGPEAASPEKGFKGTELVSS